MCNVSLSERKSSEELRNRLHIPDIADLLRQERLRWFGHVERMEDDNPVSQCRNIEVAGTRTKGRPRKTWNQVIKKDLQQLNLNPCLAQDRKAWKELTKKKLN